MEDSAMNIKKREIASHLHYFITLSVATIMLTSLISKFANGAPYSNSSIEQNLDQSLTKPDSQIVVNIKAPRHYVFDFLVNKTNEFVKNASSLRIDHSASLTPGMLSEGSERVIYFDSGEKLFERFIAINPPSNFSYYVDTELSETKSALKYSVSNYRLEEISDSETQVIVSVAYKADTKVPHFIVKRAINSALRRDFNKAATLIESQYAASGMNMQNR